MIRSVIVLVALAAVACGPSERERRDQLRAQGEGRSRGLSGATDYQRGEDRCDADELRHEVSEYDTSGDEYPDVRKVFLRVGDPPIVRLVLICREADLNADGVKDVVRYYTDEGRPLREESDRNFDGQMDEILFFEDGRIVRIEQDTSGNGQVDSKIYYEDGRPTRAERDQAGRSSATDWRPDTWEYYENGRMIRMGVDLDGDGRVDRWDRDEIYRQQQAEREAREEADRAREQGEGEAPVDDPTDSSNESFDEI